MLQLQNDTPFVANLSIIPDERGVDTVYLAIKATFDIRGGVLRVSPVQRPLVMADEYWGEPGQSSLKYASEVHLLKPHTDVVLVGEAHAPHGRPVESCLVSVKVGDLRKVLQVFGERRWTRGLVSPRSSSPEPFVTMPLVYERAFGGAHVVEGKRVLAEERNPVGRSFQGKRSNSEMIGTMLPNLEDPLQLMQAPSDRPVPAGVGYVAPSWEPRKSMAGSYDESWQRKRAPYLPLDFKREFFQAASVGLRSQGHLRGGAPVEILNASPVGVLRFTLPTCTLAATVRIAGQPHEPSLQLETVLLEPGAERLCLLWRGAVPCDKRALKVQSAHVRLTSLDGAEWSGG